MAACTPFKPALNNADALTEYPVKGRQGLLINQKISFDTYTSSRVKRSWTKGGNTRLPVAVNPVVDFWYPELLAVDATDKSQTFCFQLSDGLQNHSDAYASAHFETERLLVGNNPNSVVNIMRDVMSVDIDRENMFYAQVFINQDAKPWQLVLDNIESQKNAKQYTGLFEYDKGRYYQLKPITHLQTSQGPKAVWMGSVGYEISNPAGQTVAAVSLMDKGMVYLSNANAEERFLLANLCTILLLQQNLAE
ncbi:hypothetical protein EZL74_05670 [Flavobacterium silvisoli]|uniref:Uncharacterized protein n=1 Tax=Flavobacterium silvisoli TaxID=2529433 RepID=A0A4Q9Z1H1_9FLAO|nr:hypothetical protein [Flavobacterium silvisoli]TBX69904.1 hypothetical protein EZL74_05670 [Flavobacterium silvisoli]